MSQKVDFKSVATVVGKEYSPAREEMIVNERKIPAKADTFNLYVMFGTTHENYPELYDTKPTVLSVEVAKIDYLKIRNRQTVNALIRNDNGKMSIRELENIPIILKKEDIDEEEKFREEIEQIELMKALEKQADKPKK